MTRSRSIVWLAVVTAVGFAIRVALIRQSLFGDELFTFEIATRDSLSAVLAGVRSGLEVSPPGYNILAWGAHWLGDPMVSIRIPSLAAGTALIPIVYALAVAARDCYAGLLGALLIALSPFATFYAVEARPYSVLMLLLALSTLVLLRATKQQKTFGWWAAFAVLTTLALYTHYTAVFVIAAQAVWVLVFCRQRLPALVLSLVAALLLFAAWVPELLNDQSSPNSTIFGILHPLSVRSFLRDIVIWTTGLPFSAPRVVPGRFALALDLLALLALLFGAALTLARGQRCRVTPPQALVAMTAVAAPLGLIAYSLFRTSIFDTRNMTSSLPALVALIAAVVVSLPRRIAIAGAALLVAGFLVGAVVAFDPANRRPNAKAVAAVVDGSAPNDVLLDYSGFANTGPLAQQIRISLKRPRAVIPGKPFHSTDRETAAASLARARSGRILLVAPASPGADATPVIPGFHLVGRREFRGFARLAVLIYSADHPRGN